MVIDKCSLFYLVSIMNIKVNTIIYNRLPVLSDPETIKIVKKYLDEAEFEVFEVK